MIHPTRGIVLRAIKYGETSLVVNIFTAHFGVLPFLLQGVRSAGAKRNKAALMQPSTLLEMETYHRPQKSLQRLREFHYAYIYQSLQQEVAKNSIALFSVEMLLRLLPEEAPMPELFDFAFDYFITLDHLSVTEVANFPIYFVIQCSRLLGYELLGTYSPETPYLNLQEGGFSSLMPQVRPFMSDEDATILASILQIREMTSLKEISISGDVRNRLLDWYLEFLHQHTQHLGQLKSLSVLRTILR